jgi:outer membrane biosynthesis protein TonB
MRRRTKIANALLLAFIAAACMIAPIPHASAALNSQNDAVTSSPSLGVSVSLLNRTKGADFSAYIKRLIGSFKQKLSPLLPESVKNGKKGIVTLQVQLRKDGSVAAGYPVALTGTGDPTTAEYKEMEAASIAAVRTAAPYGPFPEAYPDSTLMLKISFFFNISPGRSASH